MSDAPRIAPELADLPHVPVTALEPLQGSLKELTRREYNKLKRSITDYGLIVPFFVWQEAGKLLDGHQRQRVMRQEGWELDVPVVYISATDEQDAKRKLLVVSSQYGRVTQEGWDEFTWDIPDDWLTDTTHFDALPFVFGDWEPDPEPPAGADAEPQVNRAEELREEWGTEPGQLWRLPSRVEGQEHRLICGDCTDGAVVAAVMDGENAALVFTDPPYNHASENSGYAAPVSPSHQALMDSAWDKEFRFDSVIPVLESVMGEDCTVYVCTSWHLAGDIWSWMSKHSSHYSYCVWSKSNPMPSLAKRHWTWASELICYATYGRHTFNFPAEGHAPNVWVFTKHKETDHPTEKPIEVPEHAIKHSSKAGDIVFDGFLGSGTTIIACENLSRQCRAVEISPAYVAVALERYWQAFGIRPVLIQ